MESLSLTDKSTSTSTSTTSTEVTPSSTTSTTTTTTTNNRLRKEDRPKNNEKDTQTYFESEYDIDMTIKENKIHVPKDRLKVTRQVYCIDAIEWLKNNELSPNTSVITSLPDIVEMSGYTLPQYKEWFVNAVRLITSKLSDNNVAIFYQTDIKRKWKKDKSVTEEYVDKGYMVQKGAELSECKVLFHKLMLSHPVETEVVTRNKASFTHMICIAKNPSSIMHQDNTPDVAPRGAMVWPKAMGLNACLVAVRFIRGVGSTSILDCFCGKGSVLGTANLLGLSSIGVDLSVAKCRNSHSLVIESSTIEKFNQTMWKEKQKKKDDGKEKDETKMTTNNNQKKINTNQSKETVNQEEEKEEKEEKEKDETMTKEEEL
ncbi:hypothetical protein DFA_07250 [Cavenderia fasciculata]|uniref:Uncharacterized protein n=1 Tax=Cavenderia fasciculata TaxID=261658 RepID=F4PVW6_CACFS|nr:uncharacterized protein DFA_07250 [Cavenderia fasciculata]EGG20130.1 hypothetical protein DFA_07250 [Cavenderia fasciculata]|eukprot:XP_004367113.1 hypothetical protein DFA_07250 [Cavenderia fasciculata]